VDAERIVQGMTKVRRIIADKPGGPYVAVEFIELADDELTEMIRVTNLAARKPMQKTSEMQMAAV